jgi:phage shock protein C
MSLSEELGRLGALREQGVLSDEEFAINTLRRSRNDRWLGGVCGGIARFTGAESWIWRLLFALLALCAGTGVLVYVLMWILVPAEPIGPGQVRGYPQAG